jgi:hypothetical protein
MEYPLKEVKCKSCGDYIKEKKPTLLAYEINKKVRELSCSLEISFQQIKKKLAEILRSINFKILSFFLLS